ncbi:MAG: thiamine-phosphate kinase [Planctomycetota bacterium]
METSFLAYVRGRCRRLPQVELGIGDDAAVYEPRGRQVVCTDQIIDRVDFELDQHCPADIGFKSVAINLSDIAAMGARPRSMLVTLAVPRRPDNSELAAAVYEGIIEAAAEYHVAIIGGDLSVHDGPLMVSVTMIGELDATWTPWKRSGGKVGDAVYLSGPVGGSLLGRHLRPKPRLDLVDTLRDDFNVTAAIDVSDSLSIDLDRLCAASGIGVRLDVDAIPIHRDAEKRSEETGRSPFRHAWSDGEDFELLLCVAPEDASRIESARTEASSPLGDLQRIGELTSRRGLWKLEAGKLLRLPPQGFIHGGE